MWYKLWKETTDKTISSSFIRFFVFALQGTFGASLILKAQQLDKLPKVEQDLEIQKFRSRKQTTSGVPVASPASNDDLEQNISHLSVSPFLHPAATALSHGDTESQGLSASEVNPLRKQTPEEGYCFFNRWAEEESTAMDSSAGPFSGQCPLVPSRVTAPGQDSGKLTKGNVNHGSHRRSVSAVTLWRKIQKWDPQPMWRRIPQGKLEVCLYLIMMLTTKRERDVWSYKPAGVVQWHL